MRCLEMGGTFFHLPLTLMVRASSTQPSLRGGPHSDPHQLVPSKVEPGYVSGKSKSYIEYLLSNVFLTTPLTL